MEFLLCAYSARVGSCEFHGRGGGKRKAMVRMDRQIQVPSSSRALLQSYFLHTYGWFYSYLYYGKSFDFTQDPGRTKISRIIRVSASFFPTISSVQGYWRQR